MIILSKVHNHANRAVCLLSVTIQVLCFFVRFYKIENHYHLIRSSSFAMICRIAALPAYPGDSPVNPLIVGRSATAYQGIPPAAFGYGESPGYAGKMEYI